jgi:hypothetical protein
MKFPAAAYSAEVATSATKAGSYGVFGEGEYIISHQNLQSKSLQPIYLSSSQKYTLMAGGLSRDSFEASGR